MQYVSICYENVKEDKFVACIFVYVLKYFKGNILKEQIYKIYTVIVKLDIQISQIIFLHV